MSKSGLLNGATKASKLQDDANMKALRELSQVPCNRHCFDCGQRGPTYIDTTIGSFVCMTCSGLLRGLTPPHRVKSISMASFSADEIETLKSKGNEYCRKVWLATHTARDSHLGSEADPDRRNALKSHMSAKYEQKRYYVDPSKLSKSELTEIQAQTVRALSSSSISNSSSSGGSAGSITMQKSPSLSSASSGSSLSLHQQQQQQQQNNPSPVMNNLRNSQQPHRLVNSVTLPDIKPLSTLIGSVNIHPSNGTTHYNQSSVINSPAPINFINNLSSHDEKIINTNQSQSSQNAKDPWGSVSFGDPNGFNTNFANFDEAFCGINGNGNGNFAQADLFNSPPTKPSSNGHNGISNGFGGGSSVPPPPLPPANNFANFDSLQQKPLIPFHNGTNGHSNHLHHHSNSNGDSSSQIQKDSGALTNGSSSNGGGGGGLSAQDRYAALKDLDDMFKHVEPVAGSGGGGVSNGMPTSASVPANLSSSSAGGGGPGWYSTSPNQPNPFSQVGASPPNNRRETNGWGINGTSSSTGTNPHNPFFSSPSWQTSSSNTNTNSSNCGIINGNNHINANNTSSMFPGPTSQPMNFHHFSSSSINNGGFPPMGTPPSANNLFSQQQHQSNHQNNSSSHFIMNNSSQATKPVFNPFNFANSPGNAVNPTANPNNPFL